MRLLFRTLGYLMFVATCINLARNGLSIDLYGTPARLIAIYVWLREMLFWPISEILRNLGLALSPATKDVLLAYALIASAHYSTIQSYENWFRAKDERMDKPPRSRTPLSNALWATVWPLLFVLRWRSHRQWVRKFDYYEKRHSGILARSDRDKMVDEWAKDHIIGGFRRFNAFVTWNVVVAAIGTALFFYWSYLSNAFGPPV